MLPLTVTLIQSNLHWQNKAANLSMFEEKINQLAGKTELVILPEMFNTGFCLEPAKLSEKMDGETVNWMKRIAMNKKLILAGSLMVEEEGKYFNRLVWMLPNGHYGVYDKRHRFAYGGEDHTFTAGSKRIIASVKGWRINLQVCYDLRFPVWARQSHPNPGEDGSALEFDILLYVANWPERRSLAWKTLLQARAIENQCYVIGVNRTGDDGNHIHYSGDSMVIDPLGEILYSKHEAEDIFTISLDRERLEETRNKMPFWRDSDQFSIFP